ncbi:hypothetical protein RAS12_13395 [Achromobacter seleniivolatilans]|uniref:Uncharacterized protein n=1 Tax=Achromobacter seleniivolatilans TaxID=3047478 RepID=A0ABY9M8Z9_9BURK|nr:hypothetical protein [Achromobacter sp. R39]WMD23320.1 hypothetical protein RAS12_13395 [Achromobacter sp. R39]
MNKDLGLRDAIANLTQGYSPSENAPKSIPEYAFAAIRRQVEQYEKELENVPGSYSICLTSGGYDMVVESIRLDGQFIIFSGRDESDGPRRVIQHYTQVSMVLSKAPPTSAKKPIGFHAE